MKLQKLPLHLLALVALVACVPTIGSTVNPPTATPTSAAIATTAAPPPTTTTAPPTNTPTPAGHSSLYMSKVELGIHRQLAAQISLGMFMHIARLAHKAWLIALRQLFHSPAQAVYGLSRQAPALRFVTIGQGGFELIPAVIP